MSLINVMLEGTRGYDANIVVIVKEDDIDRI